MPYYKPEIPQFVPWDSKWRQIPEFPSYWLSNRGQVFNMKRGHLIALYLNTNGIICVSLFNDKRRTSRSVPKLVREIFGAERQWPMM
jgi:hypothetical protein